MARLPPKLPVNMSSAVSQAWSSYPHHHQLPRPPSMPSFFPSSPTPSPEATSNPSWVDDFFDFSSTKRGAHRRIVSDSITFFDSYPVEAADSCAAPVSSSSDFDHLDDENLIAISSNDGPPQPPSEHPPTTPSTPSDHNSNSHQDKRTPPPWGSDQSEAQSDCNAEPPNPMAGMEPVRTPAPETSPPIADPKRVRRILANRQSAQRSRVRKLQYISELERSVTTLQMEVSALSPRVACLDHQRSVLNIGNSHLRQRIAALAQDQIFKDARQDALQNEIERLRHVYTQQNLKKVMDSAGASAEITVVADMELNLPACIDRDSSSEC